MARSGEAARLSTRRDSWAILGEVLRLADLGGRKTRIMFGANLSYEVLSRYIAFCVERGFLVEEDGAYTLTAEGRELARRIQGVQELLEVTPGESPSVPRTRSP